MAAQCVDRHVKAGINGMRSNLNTEQKHTVGQIYCSFCVGSSGADVRCLYQTDSAGWGHSSSFVRVFGGCVSLLLYLRETCWQRLIMFSPEVTPILILLIPTPI